jgi:hypothetical protein
LSKAAGVAFRALNLDQANTLATEAIRILRICYGSDQLFVEKTIAELELLIRRCLQNRTRSPLKAV